MNMLNAMMYSQPTFSLMKERMVPNTSAADSGKIKVQAMNSNRNPAAENVTCGWMSNPHLTMFLSPGSRSATSG